MLDGSSKVIVNRGNTELHEMESFTLALSLQLDDDEGHGVFLHMHRAFQASISEEGALNVTIRTEDGAFNVTTTDGLFNDMTWHRVAGSYDGDEGGAGLQIFFDGVLAGQTAATGALAADGSYNLVLGNTWIDSLKGTVDDMIIDDVAHGAETLMEDYLAMEQALDDAATQETMSDAKSSDANLDVEIAAQTANQPASDQDSDYGGYFQDAAAIEEMAPPPATDAQSLYI